MPAPDIIKQLVERFEEQKADYLSTSYTETPVRRDFIDPFFKALGWDIDNNEGYAETYRDVIHEDKVNVEGKLKSPDYSFRVGGVRKFFVEAKQPSVSIKSDPKSAFQLRRYGWSGKLPVSILTDFEEMAVYDCTIKPNEKDTASKGRIILYTYKDYVEKWDDIAGLFSKQAVLKGSFDRYVDKKKKGTQTIDNEFLADIEAWRQSLASNILLNNTIGQRELNYAVQIIIDRIIFLRICEDRGIEPYGKLEKLKNGKSDLYKKLVLFFKNADDKYNSGLFHFNNKDKAHTSQCDALTPKLRIDDEPLQAILDRLYFPNPYEFSVIPADILGQVYERFLGNVIEINGKVANVNPKPDVKKAGGVFYTPTYVVEYIVTNTVDKMLEGKNPKQVAGLTILDPSCGSGSFLIVAYQHVLDWHLEYYLRNGGAAKFKKQLHQTQKGAWRLSTQERKRILLGNIYGVDIDSQAVEVTKLSLLLKVLEGESDETIGSQLKMFHERALPDLGSNIKCGNSLIEQDFYAQTELPELTDDDHYRINVFNWRDSFSHVFKQGGFDAIIGNPPYIFARGERFSDYEKNYLYRKFKEQNYQLNTYPIFMEHGISLLKKNGKFGYIVPSNWLTIGTLKAFRNYILSNVGNLNILNYDYKVFNGANVDTSTVIFEKSKPTSVKLLFSPEQEILQEVKECPHEELMRQEAINFTSGSNAYASILAKMNSCLKLGDITEIKCGLKAYQVGKGAPAQTIEVKDNRLFHANRMKSASYGKYLQGVDVKRYLLDWSGEWLSYGNWLAEPRRSAPFNGERILVRQIPSKPPYMINGCLVSDPYYNDINSMIIFRKSGSTENLKTVLGLLNSKLLSFWFNQTYQKLQRGIFPQFKVNELAQFPIALVAGISEKIAAKVDDIMALQIATKNTSGRIAEAKIMGLNTQLDELACQAFCLTTEERRLVDCATQ